MPVGRPFKPGVSGCPGGVHGLRERTLAAMTAEFAPLTELETARLAVAVDSLIESRRPKLDPDQRNKCRRTANAILKELRTAREARRRYGLRREAAPPVSALERYAADKAKASA